MWLDMARQDLATAYRALGRPADADRFQAELAASRRRESEQGRVGGARGRG